MFINIDKINKFLVNISISIFERKILKIKILILIFNFVKYHKNKEYFNSKVKILIK
jgi:hypothetical protein